jgi:hypothetical protein
MFRKRSDPRIMLPKTARRAAGPLEACCPLIPKEPFFVALCMAQIIHTRSPGGTFCSRRTKAASSSAEADWREEFLLQSDAAFSLSACASLGYLLQFVCAFDSIDAFFMYFNFMNRSPPSTSQYLGMTRGGCVDAVPHLLRFVQTIQETNAILRCVGGGLPRCRLHAIPCRCASDTLNRVACHS